MDAFQEDGDVRQIPVKVSKSLAAGLEPYEATRGIWRVDLEKAREADLVLGISEDTVENVLAPTAWKPARRAEFPRHPGEPGGRYAFDGAPPDPGVAAKYPFKRVPERLASKSGAANPVRYFW